MGYCDELPEFPSKVLESLRQPMEDRKISISRAGAQVTYPANIQIIAAMNPCRCGYVSDPERKCSKAPICSQNYLNKISGPILDRIDIFVEVDYAQNLDLFENSEEISSEELAILVEKSRQTQLERYTQHNIKTNAEASSDLIDRYTVLSRSDKDLLNETVKKFRLSMRSFYKILKVARTIADFEGSKNVDKAHLSEAISYRYKTYGNSLNRVDYERR